MVDLKITNQKDKKTKYSIRPQVSSEMKLITEEISNVKIITEGKGSNKKLYIEGVFLQGESRTETEECIPSTL